MASGSRDGSSGYRDGSSGYRDESSGYRDGSSGSAPSGYTPVHRVPTDSSYYSFDGTPWDNRDANAQTWMYAREARQQQADTIAGTRKHSYPSYYRNSEELPLSTPGTISPYNGRREWLHQPLVPGRETAWAPRTGTPKGAVRSFYTRGTPTEFDVGFHDPKAGKTPGGSDNFSLARYHAAVPPPPRSPTI